MDIPGFAFRQGRKIYIFSQSPDPFYGPSIVILERPEREADHSPPSSAAFKNEWIFTLIPLYIYGMYMDFKFFLPFWDKEILNSVAVSHCF